MRRGIPIAMSGLLTLLVASVPLSGLASAKTRAPSQTITVWVHPLLSNANQEAALFNRLDAMFTRQYPNIHVTVQDIPWANWDAKNITGLLAVNGGPDVIYAIPDQMPQYAEKGLITPMPASAYRGRLNQFQTGALQAVKYKGHIYGLPMLQSCVGYYYNMDIMHKAGIKILPHTFAQLRADLLKVKKIGKVGLDYEANNTPDMSYYPFLWGFGGNVTSSKGQVTVANRAGIAAMSYVVGLYKSGLMNKDAISASTNYSAFAAGDAAVVQDDQTFLTSIATQVKFPWTVGPAIGSPPATFTAVGAYVIPTHSKNKAAAAEWIRFMTSSAADRVLLKATDFFSPLKSLASMWKSNHVMDTLAHQLPYARPGFISPVSRQLEADVPQQVQSAMLGQESPAAAARTLASDLQELLHP